MKFTTQISSILMALLFVYTINFKSILTINYLLNTEEITELFCINKEKPKLECNGKCHLANQLVEVEKNENETPFSGNQTLYNIELITIICSTLFNTNNTFKTVENTYWYNQYHILESSSSVPSPPPKA